MMKFKQSINALSAMQLYSLSFPLIHPSQNMEINLNLSSCVNIYVKLTVKLINRLDQLPIVIGATTH